MAPITDDISCNANARPGQRVPPLDLDSAWPTNGPQSHSGTRSPKFLPRMICRHILLAIGGKYGRGALRHVGAYVDHWALADVAVYPLTERRDHQSMRLHYTASWAWGPLRGDIER
jgi:hypothetical protein